MLSTVLMTSSRSSNPHTGAGPEHPQARTLTTLAPLDLIRIHSGIVAPCDGPGAADDHRGDREGGGW